jgi:hypothetical protein
VPLVTVELVERPRENQRMHFEVLIKIRIKLSHDALRCTPVPE